MKGLKLCTSLLIIFCVLALIFLNIFYFKATPTTTHEKNESTYGTAASLRRVTIPTQISTTATTSKPIKPHWTSVYGKGENATSTAASVRKVTAGTIPTQISTTATRPTSKPIKLHWTSVYGKGENDSYHFFAAYYDNRVSAPNRPAVIVIGYVRWSVPVIKLYCVFRFSNGSKVCSKYPATEDYANCHNERWPAKAMNYFCMVSASEEPPVSVRISSKSSCEPAFTSAEIPVQNRHNSTKNKMKKFGVCVQGPVVQNDGTMLQRLIQFIEMNKVLGAEVIYMYHMQIEPKVQQYILEHYSDIVLVIEWKKFEMWSPLHYYGQLLLISDCSFRSMHEVKFLVINDLDEIILPVKHDNWEDMLNFLNSNKHERYASYTFLNRLFIKSHHSTSQDLIRGGKRKCPNGLQVPMYFTRIDNTCISFSYDFRTKFIIRPKFMVLSGIHNVCKSVEGYTMTYNVPPDLGINAHYRYKIPTKECYGYSRVQPNHAALKFADKVLGSMCPAI